MLLHYAIRIVEKNQSINDSSTMTNLDFRLINPNTGKKYDYPVFGKNCNHFGEKFINLQDVVNGFNSQNRSYECPHCQIVYEEVSDFVPHDLYIRIKNDFHPLTDKISVLHGILLSHIKRNKKRFGDPLISNKIQQQIKFLLTENNEDQFQKAQQFSYLASFDQRLKSNNQFQFQSLCLLDNVNINIPVRHKDCKHVEAYELTSLICYQIENYRDLKNKQLQERESNQYLKCIKKGCSSIFPLISDQKLLDCLVVDFEFLKTIKRSYPGNQLFVVSKIYNDVISLSDFISNSISNKDQFISTYWNKNKNELDQLFKSSFSEFQRIVLEKMATVINLELHKNVKEKINQYKNSNCQMKLKDQSGQMVEFPARCVNCPIPKENESQYSETKIPLLNWDIRTFVAFIVHKQKQAEHKKQNSEKLQCPLCQTEFKKNLVQIQFNNELIFYDAQLYSKMQINIEKIRNEPNNLFSYQGKEYLLDNFKNLWRYTCEDFLSDEKNSEIYKIYYESIKCSNFEDIRIKDPLINFKCKKQIRFNFDYFYEKFKQNQFQFKNGIKLCKCQETDCGLVTEIEEQLYYDHVWVEAFAQKPLHCNCEYGFSYDVLNKEFKELKKGEFLFQKLIPPVVRHFKEDETLERGTSFKIQQSAQMQKMRQQSLMEQQ
ncbi:unnamed protein product [Paramecium pentaurelia]|uniref:Uncharacterized protein n=1 Tax=Paramecium pentaurelia TaxID=43138 RepID=A0A8S1SKI6_9CILI|nr:unnamed protein product [Paramecium pentaurelia]